MKKLLCSLLVIMACSLQAQQIIPISVKELAPDFGIRPIFLDDTIHVARYLDSLPGSNSDHTDTCVTLNAKLMAMENVLLYDYRHSNDTVWIDASHYIDDYIHYSAKIQLLSQYILRRAHDYIESEHILQDNNQQAAISLRKDTINRYHRTILNACEGIGVTDKDRKKQLKDIYYAYLSVYNRYDFSNKHSDPEYLASLDEFCDFQEHIIDNILSPNNYTARIQNFINTLKVRCGHTHSDVLRSYQRAFRQGLPEVKFSSIRQYHEYVESLQSIIDIQNAYLTVVDLREQITATGKRINSLYYPKFNDASKTYNEVASTINIIPAFNSRHDANLFIQQLEEFIEVQDCYVDDYSRLMAIIAHGDTITRRCGAKYADVARAYRQANTQNFMIPNYQSLDDARRFARKMDYFEYLQRQFDSIIDLRKLLDSTKDSITHNWAQHLAVFNGYQNIRKQFVLTPTFIDTYGGSEFISHLQDYHDMQNTCIRAIHLYQTSKQLDEKIAPDIQPYRNINKVYNLLRKEYLNLKAINHISDLVIYIHQYEAFITVQEAVIEKLNNNGTLLLDDRLKTVKELKQMETLLGL